jgi:threonine/homoserine/homoserine lactone efflux protein
MEDWIARLSGLGLVCAIYFANVASPGPSNMAVMALSIERGRKAGFALAAGVIAGSFTWAGLAAIGVAALLQAYAGALVFLKIGGALYFFYLAWRAAKSACRAAAPASATAAFDRREGLRLFVCGYLIHVSNPKAILGWVATMAMGLRVGEDAAPLAAILGVCFAIGCAVFSTYVFVFSSATMAAFYARVRRWAEAGFAAFFAYAGFRLLTTRL